MIKFILFDSILAESKRRSCVGIWIGIRAEWEGQ